MLRECRNFDLVENLGKLLNAHELEINAIIAGKVQYELG